MSDQMKVIVWQAMSSLMRKLASHLFIFNMLERFVDAGSVDNFVAEQENKATLQKNFANLFRNQE